MKAGNKYIKIKSLDQSQMVHPEDEKFLLNIIIGMTNSCTVGYVLR